MKELMESKNERNLTQAQNEKNKFKFKLKPSSKLNDALKCAKENSQEEENKPKLREMVIWAKMHQAVSFVGHLEYAPKEMEWEL